jgi:eukaryotic-like serine/threonine-protein kinase
MSFLAELKRRRIVRVAIVYAATAFVVLQAADLIDAGLALPSWVFAALTLLVILGFPLALVLAWAFQITRDDAAASSRAERWITGRTLAVVACALIIVVAGGWLLDPLVTARMARSATAAGPLNGPYIASLLPAQGESWGSGGGAFAVSPDGRSIAIVATGNGAASSLVLRRLHGLATTPLPGTTGATGPFWSPDGASIGFFAGGRLRVLDLASGTVRALCPATAPTGGAWGARDVILYSPERSAGLHRTSARGGPCEPVPLRGSAQPGWGVPFFLGDGRHFVFGTDDDVWLGRVDGDSLTHLRQNRLSTAVGVPPDWLLFRAGEGAVGAGSTWSAQRIDLRTRRLAGEPLRLLDGIVNPGGRSAVSASATGVLVVQGPGATGPPTLIRVERGGGVIDSLVVRERVWTFRPSHDGRRIAFGGWALWLHDVERGINTRVAAPPDTALQTFAFPVWSPGDTLIAFAQRYRRNALALFDVRAGAVQPLFESADRTRMMHATDWSRDGQWLAFVLDRGGGSVHAEAWAYDFVAQQTRRLFHEDGNVGELRFSPDGRWIAYQSDAGGDRQVYLRRSDGSGTALRVSRDGGRLPRWRADGAELYYATPSGAVMAVAVRLAGEPILSTPQPAVPLPPLGLPLYDEFEPSRDGRSFTLQLSERGGERGLVLVLDWPALLAISEARR